MNMKRIDIKQHDVFISWTGADRELKNRIVEYLRKNKISCLESDHQCSGDFRQWSREAVGVCNIFLPIVSPTTFQSKFVPIEVEEYKKLENYENRIVPVWTSKEVFDAEPWNIKEYGSSVILDENGLTEAVLKIILDKVVSLIVNFLDAKYKQASKSEYIKLISLSRMSKNISRDFDFSKLYINRILCETDEQGQKQEENIKTKFLYNSDSVFFIYGSAGCGKSQYINQIRENAPEDVVIICLPCSKIISSPDVFSSAFKEFSRVSGKRYYYTENDFVSLLNNRRVILVFDGMDEIATVEDKRRLISKAEDFYKANRNNTILVFTGRNLADADLIAIDGKKVRRFLLENLSEDEIRTLSENLFICFNRKNEFNTFFDKISNLNEEIRSNPLLLSQLAIIYYDKKYVPESIIEIYDAISEITLKLDNSTELVIPEEYKEMVGKKILGLLKDFSKERYLLLSKGKNVEPQKIFSRILKAEKYEDDIQRRSEFLVDYLENRKVFVDGEFYHKMLLEYFTAVKYYESAFDDYDEIEDIATIEELFSNYADPYWSAVIKMFLVKADGCIDESATKSLYELITQFGICEYTLLFDTCRDLLNSKEYAQNVLVSDIIKKSTEGVYPSYGPLFWYAPEYGLYEMCLVALDSLKNEPCFAKMLALIRDVCFIMGGKYTAESFTDKVSPAKLFAAAQGQLSGIRKALCELFYLGATDFSGGEDVYPRCFNVSEAKSFMKNGCGVIGRMSTPFYDEIGLFSHTSYNELNDEFIGIVSCPYVICEIESKLSKKSCRKLTGLILSSAENTKMEYIAINRKHIKVVYVPENTESLDRSCDSLKDDFLHILWGPTYTDFWSINMPLSLGIVVLDNKLLYYSPKANLPDGIKKIPYRIFGKSTVPESISLPPSVEEIDKYAFEYCDSLKSVIIPESLKRIGEGAFLECRSLTSVRISEGVTEIEKYAFEGCGSLRTINIPDSITEIGFGAFESCSSLTSINIPGGITKIKGGTFLGCSSLISVNIADCVVKIESSAFEGCSSLVSVNIPEGVAEIGSEAFKDCNSLISVKIPNRVVEIGKDAFEGCDGLMSVEISIRFKGIIKSVFPNINPDIIHYLPLSDNDVMIPYGTEKIKDSEFAGKRNINSIIIPETVTEIGQNAFKDCKSLKLVVIPESVTKIGNNAFEGCCSLKSISIPKSVKKIGEGAFLNCCSLTSINVPDGVTEISNCSFKGCSSLTSINTTDNVTEIGSGAFEGCRSLSSIKIPDGVIQVGSYAFKNCSSLTSVDIPNSVIRIGSCAFEGCSSLNFGDVPDSVIEIGSDVFKNCDKMWGAEISIRFKNDIKNIFSNINPKITFRYPSDDVVIPDGTTEIRDNEFSGQTNIRTITIPEGVTKIGDSAFLYCCSLTSVNVPKTVTEIGKLAFLGCNSLESINIPESVTKIGFLAFFACTSLTSVSIPDGVTEIRAFGECHSLRLVSLPESVTKIGDNAFEDCISLASIKIPKYLTEIGDNAFSGCSLLTNVDLPKCVTKIGSEAFKDCRSLTSVNVPDGVTEIAAKTFSGCSSLTVINIPKRATKINEGSFENCSSLTSISIPDSVPEIGKDSFKNCSSLTSIEIPSTVRIIGDDAFNGCTNLTSIKISRRFEDDIQRIFGDINHNTIIFLN